jgi:hypothetical protein
MTTTLAARRVPRSMVAAALSGDEEPPLAFALLDDIQNSRANTSTLIEVHQPPTTVHAWLILAPPAHLNASFPSLRYPTTTWTK